jgi:hypothetical protein
MIKNYGRQVIRFHNYHNTAATIMLSHRIPPVIAAGMLGHSISILLTSYAHFIINMQDQAAQPARKNSSLGFTAKYAAQLMDEILTPVPIELVPLSEIIKYPQGLPEKV